MKRARSAGGAESRVGLGAQPAELDAAARPSSRSGPRTRVCSVNRPACCWRLSGRNFSSPSMRTLRLRYWTPLVPPQPERSAWTSSARPSPPLAEEARADLAGVLDLVVAIFGDAAAQPDLAEEAAQRDFGAGVAAGLPDVDGRRLGLDVGVEREADRHAV